MVQYFPVITGSLTVNGNLSVSGNVAVTGSMSGTSSLAANAELLSGTGSVGFTTTGSFTVASSSLSSRTSQIESVYATTGSNSFRATQSITGSLTVTGQIVAQTLNVQQVTSSIVYSSGSNVFGCDINSRQTFTGSFYQTGSLASFSSCIGIGTSSPCTMLNILYPSNIGKDTVQGIIRLTGQSCSENGVLVPSAGTAIEFYNKWTASGSPDEYAIGRISGRGTVGFKGALQFDVGTGVTAGCSTFTTAMTILSNGNLGVGTTTPSDLLHIEKCQAGGMGIIIRNACAATSNTSMCSLISLQLVGAGQTGQLGVNLIAGKEGDYSSGGTRNAFFAIQTACGDNLYERMRITSGGITCFANSVCVPTLRATSVDISAGSSAAFSFGVDQQSTFAFGGLNGRRVAIIRDGTCADNGLQFGYDVVDKTGVIAGSATAAGVGIDFYTYNGSAWGNRTRLTKDGITCFSNTICTPKIGYNGYGGITAHDLVVHFDAGSTNIATLSGENAYTRVAAHIEWVSNYALAGTNMTMGYTIVDTRRGNSNTIWVNCACTILAYGDSPANPTFGWSGGVLSVSVPGSTGLSARFRITTYAATLTPNI